MCPTDTTPDPRDMLRAPDPPEFPQPKDGPAPDPALHQPAPSDDGEADLAMGERPPLPEHPAIMAADVEDEEADPVVDTGPGIAVTDSTRSDSVLNRG